jgi:hypothetical protein
MIYGMWFNSSGGGGGGATSVGDLLQKTGQTTSYRTGDDGDIEAGRKVDFTTLKANNPFGNTNRFTDELGTQVYANDIVIDWSTYDGSEVLGYYRVWVLGATSNWDGTVDACLAHSVGTFTSGWRCPNARELANIIDYSQSIALNYAPFNISIGYQATSSTTRASNTNQAFVLSLSGSNLSGGNKTNLGQRTLPVRNFTVTGTTLT